MQTIQMYINAAPGNAMVSALVPRTGKLVGLQYTFNADLDADTEYVVAELATVPTMQSATNQAQGTIFTISSYYASAAAGPAVSGQTGYCPIPSIAVEAGQNIYINSVGTVVAMRLGLLIYLQ